MIALLKSITTPRRHSAYEVMERGRVVVVVVVKEGGKAERRRERESWVLEGVCLLEGPR